MTTSIVGTISRLGLLQALPGLDELAGPAMAVVAELARERHYPARARLAGPRRASAVAHVVVEGELALETPSGRRQRICVGQHIGWWTVLADEAMDHELWTRGGALTLAIDREALLEIAEHSSRGFEVLHGLARSIAGRLVQRATSPRRHATVLRPDHVFELGVEANTDSAAPALGTVERILHMRRLPIFRGVNLDVVSQLAAALDVKRVRAGELLWPVDEHATVRPLLVLRGRVEWEADATLGASLAAPALVGLPHALSGTPIDGRPRAATELLALEVDIELLLDLAEDNSDLALGLVTALASRLREETRAR